MAHQINQRERAREGAAFVSDFNRKFTPNTPCFYQPVRNEDKWYPTRTRSEAWMLGHGEPVVKIDGASGCVCISHLAMPGSDRYEASIAESEEARSAHNDNWVPFPGDDAAPTKPKAITVPAFLRELRGDLENVEAGAAVLNVVAEYQQQADQLQKSGQFADEYHTFDELYAHRVRLFSTLMKAHYRHAWWSHRHSDGSQWEGWIIAGIFTPAGMVTYHLPVTEIENLPEGCELLLGREWDGHTAEDVLERLTSLGGPSGPSRKEAAIIEPIALEEQDDKVVYQYAASVNLPQGKIHFDGTVTGKMITGIEDYQRYRAEIATDANAKFDQVQVHCLSLVGFKAGDL